MLKIQQQPNTIYDKQLIQCVIVHAINFFIRQVEETAKEFLKNCNFQETIEHYGYYFSECDDTDDEEAYLLSLQKEEEEKEEDQIKISE
ncbi:hypothetical protein TVAG_062240 [Trichomonas vaginalis G3]|uniref:Uncharacterized protein n=1 Tax=Trichomonas vaginalis (strain ATCC PRA-98 / G3) TaxID=412133 RepID=A2G417_TRIV3|nr:hypothetical protein TVAGG3_0158970 [Trichomonas vaginalis G3]EAX88100.1 hypothetical protein TVAG_062240 [Trichomonas vaginalis G3]KAI5547727.1 hypothetical protein TVAGG3_0158970 [Trichomonas vaginalis G3]|eukprot:XP_001301030.1 hypothetical protein [Trichomonas vaginalis G3]